MQKAHPLLESAAGRLYGYFIWGPPRQRLSESMEKCTLYLSTCQIMSWFRQAVCLPRDASQDQPTSSGWNQTMPSLTNIIKLAPETIVKYLPLVSAWVSAYRNPMNFQVPLHGGPWPSKACPVASMRADDTGAGSSAWSFDSPRHRLDPEKSSESDLCSQGTCTWRQRLVHSLSGESCLTPWCAVRQRS
jgi:hypothetical protein